MRILTLMAGALLLAHAGAAQEAAAPARTVATWRLNFAFQESEGGKRLSTRNYTILVVVGRNGRLNTSARIPVPTGGGNSQYTYMDTGVNINAGLQERDGQVVLEGEVRVTMPPFDEGKPGLPPANQNFGWNGSTPLAPGKPTAMLDFDDMGTRRHFTVEVTATRLK
jgi:hypothetical protein